MTNEQNSPNPWMISTLILLGIIVGFGASQLPAFLKPEAAPSPPVAQQQAAPASPVLTAEQIAALPNDDPSWGSESAPITVVEFSDFQCPFCLRFITDTFPLIKENYINTGKVRFVYRDFPIDGHLQAPLAALAAECAEDQSKFQEMHDAIFLGQSEWAGNPVVEDILAGYAETVGLDLETYKSCMSARTHVNEVRDDLVDGLAVGVNGTPTFFVNGKYVSGALPYESVFKSIFEAELAGKSWKLVSDPATRQPLVEVE